MKGKIYLGFVFLALLFIGGCKSTKVLSSGTADPSLTAKKIIQQHYKNLTDYNTLTGKLKIEYTSADADQSVSVSLRMKKDEAIWLSAPFGMFKALITPDRVSFYNRLDNEYFDGDFAYLTEMLGTEMNFEKVQNLLLGNAILDLRNHKYETNVVNNTYKLTPKKQEDLYSIFLFVDSKYFKISRQELKQHAEVRSLDMDYTYQQVSNKIIPNMVNVQIDNKGEKTTINLEYRNIELGKTLNFPYKIPSGFKNIDAR